MKKQRWEIVFEDDHIIVINKPAHLLSIPDRYDKDLDNLFDSVSRYRTPLFINHRLDKDTSGLVLFTKNEEAHKAFSKLFEERKIDKRYMALTHGIPVEEVGLIDLPLQFSKNKQRMLVNPNGKESQTKYRVLGAWGLFACLEIKLLTGRMHQIRVHLSAIHCPIIADGIYGDGKPLYLSDFKRKFNRSGKHDEKPLLERQALHAHELHFIHPITRKSISVESPLPKDMKACIYQFNKNLDQLSS